MCPVQGLAKVACLSSWLKNSGDSKQKFKAGAVLTINAKKFSNLGEELRKLGEATSSLGNPLIKVQNVAQVCLSHHFLVYNFRPL